MAEMHVQPSELWEMEADDLRFWMARLDEVTRARNAAARR